MTAVLLQACLALTALLTLACGAPTGPAARAAPRGPDPAGPPELLTLDLLAGRWEATSETTVPASGETFPGRAESHLRWACDGRVLLEETAREPLPGSRSSDVGLWTWDAASSTYRYWRFNSQGARETGNLRYEPDERTFYLASETVEADGRTTRGAGTMRYLADDTKEYLWVTMDADSRVKLYEVRGTSRRVSR